MTSDYGKVPLKKEPATQVNGWTSRGKPECWFYVHRNYVSKVWLKLKLYFHSNFLFFPSLVLSVKKKKNRESETSCSWAWNSAQNEFLSAFLIMIQSSIFAIFEYGKEEIYQIHTI